jgi:hypothetical protein
MDRVVAQLYRESPKKGKERYSSQLGDHHYPALDEENKIE